MNSRDLNELFNIVKMLQESKLDYNYESEIKEFTKLVKGYLTSFMGNEIHFIGEKPVGCIYAIYKGSVLIIKVSNGISLTIDGESSNELLKPLENTFNAITGIKKTCSYDYSTDKSTYHVVEWSCNPEDRLNYLINDKNVENLHDYYTAKVIKSLGEEVLSMEGYVKLFGDIDSQINDESYKMVQIQKMYPNIDATMLNTWILSCRSKLSLTKKRVG